MQVYVVQSNPTVGDLTSNLEQFRQALDASSGADLLIFPELFLSGYPPQDLLLNRDFLASLAETLLLAQNDTKEYPDLTVVLGTPWQEGKKLYNSLVIIKAGSILGVQHKRNLCQFRGFAEPYYFTPGTTNLLVELGEDILAFALGLELDQSLAEELKAEGASLIVNPVAVPFQLGRPAQERERLVFLAKETNLPIVRVGQVGGNDGLIFPGGSLAVNAKGQIQAILPHFTTKSVLLDLKGPSSEIKVQLEDETEQIYQALILGLRDYVQKSGMSKALIGLSGGLDSAVATVLAVEALGAENVWAITQPGPYSDPSSVIDAQGLAENLNVKLSILPITDLYETTLASLDEYFAGTSMNVAEENIQARLRGNLIMALSNKFGGLVLTNSNKSELAVGYCTLYGDMSGGLAVIADVYKTMVYQLAYYINREREIIPWNTVEKPPSAELRPDQRDDESLPPYDILDAIIKAYLDEQQSVSEILAQGYDQETVRWVTKTIDNNDYKRKQAALILRITSPILGQDRQMPLAAKKEF